MSTPSKSFFSPVSPKIRTSLLGIGGSAAYVALYMLYPETLKLDSYLSYPIVISPAAAAISAAVLPKLISIKSRKEKVNANGQSDAKALSPGPADSSLLPQNSAVSPMPTQPQITSTGGPVQNPSNPVLPGLIQGNGGGPVVAVPATANGMAASAGANPAAPDISSIPEIIDQKVKPLIEDVSTIKGEVSSLKKNTQEIFTSFETTLTELKAFQSEIINPLNFMRKYVESLDIKSLSDPSMMFSNFRPPNPASPASPITKNPSSAVLAIASGSNAQTKPVPRGDYAYAESFELNDAGNVKAGFTSTADGSQNSNAGQRESDVSIDAYVSQTPERRQSPSDSGSRADNNSQSDSSSPANALKQIFGKNLTLGKMMGMVSMVEELVKSVGPKGVGVLVEQYKMLGLKPEDERTIYNIVTMLNDYNMSPDDILIMLYRFGQVMAINDKDADLHYARLIASKSRNNAAANQQANKPPQRIA